MSRRPPSTGLATLTTLSALAGLILAAPPRATAGDFGPVQHGIGMCDASAVVPLDDDLFVAADDEDNYLRVYSRHRGGPPVYQTSVSRFLGFKTPKGETDIEGAARLGDLVYWITSHGRNTRGKEQPRRQRFFATTATAIGGKIETPVTGIVLSGATGSLESTCTLALSGPAVVGSHRNVSGREPPGAKLKPPSGSGLLAVESSIDNVGLSVTTSLTISVSVPLLTTCIEVRCGYPTNLVP